MFPAPKAVGLGAGPTWGRQPLLNPRHTYDEGDAGVTDHAKLEVRKVRKREQRFNEAEPVQDRVGGGSRVPSKGHRMV